jgi:hypothetical protein
LRTHLFLSVAILILPLCGASAQVPEEGDLTPEVVHGCLYHMSEFGTDSVRACVNRDLAAASALRQYPVGAKEIVVQCIEQMRRNGWAMVKGCVDRDLDAGAALAEYARDHAALVERCRARVGKYGAAEVKACADREIQPVAATTD